MTPPHRPWTHAPADLELPEVRTALPGPHSQALFDRHDRHATGSNADHEVYPLAQASRRGHLIVDADGNTFADHLSAWGASPFGPTPPAVKAAMDDLNTKASAMGQAMYAAAQAKQASAEEPSASQGESAATEGADDDVVDAEIVDEGDNK